MDMLKTVREIGFFETGCNLVKVIDSKDVQAKAGEVMPLPDPAASPLPCAFRLPRPHGAWRPGVGNARRNRHGGRSG